MNVPRFGAIANTSSKPTCHPAQTTEAVVLFSIAFLGMGANIILMILIIIKRPLKRWSQGLLLHQGLVDCARASLLIPLGVSVIMCQRLPRCSVIETIFLHLVTVSMVNMLTSLINDAPIFPDHDQSSNSGSDGFVWSVGGGSTDNNHHSNLDSPHCIIFGLFMIWFASFTINLGPTFLTGALASSQDSGGHIDVCPLVYRPVRHYVLNVLWITVNLLCIGLMAIHLRKLYRDLIKSNLEAIRFASLVTTMVSVHADQDACDHHHIQNYIHRLEQEGLSRVKMFVIILVAYMLFWGPLFTVTLIQPDSSLTYEITLHVAFVHSFVNPTLLLVMHRDLRHAAMDFSCCQCGNGQQYEANPCDGGSACRLNRGYM